MWGGLPDFKALRFTRYNQYESMILPMVKYLEGFGVQFHYNTKVVNVEFDIQPGKKQAKRIELLSEGKRQFVDLTENDLVFITNGGCVENATMGSQNTVAPSTPKSSPAAAGICGAELPRRILPSVIPTSSAMILSSPTG